MSRTGEWRKKALWAENGKSAQCAACVSNARGAVVVRMDRALQLARSHLLDQVFFYDLEDELGRHTDSPLEDMGQELTANITYTWDPTLVPCQAGVYMRDKPVRCAVILNNTCKPYQYDTKGKAFTKEEVIRIMNTYNKHKPHNTDVLGVSIHWVPVLIGEGAKFHVLSGDGTLKTTRLYFETEDVEIVKGTEHFPELVVIVHKMTGCDFLKCIELCAEERRKRLGKIKGNVEAFQHTLNACLIKSGCGDYTWGSIAKKLNE